MNKKIIEELNNLIEFAPPNSLKKSLHEVFFNYLINNKQNTPENIETITSDLYFLIKFLHVLEESQ